MTSLFIFQKDINKFKILKSYILFLKHQLAWHAGISPLAKVGDPGLISYILSYTT